MLFFLKQAISFIFIALLFMNPCRQHIYCNAFVVCICLKVFVLGQKTYRCKQKQAPFLCVFFFSKNVQFGFMYWLSFETLALNFDILFVCICVSAIETNSSSEIQHKIDKTYFVNMLHVPFDLCMLVSTPAFFDWCPICHDHTLDLLPQRHY